MAQGRAVGKFVPPHRGADCSVQWHPVPDFDLPVRDNFIDIQIFVALALSELG